ncbi:Cytochrome P450 94A1 [Bienertia sinuspersici]
MISSQRFRTFFPILWKTKRFLNIGSEKKLKEAVLEIQNFAKRIQRDSRLRKYQKIYCQVSRFLKSGHTDENFVTDIVISVILAGRDTTSSALTWFFWLLHKNNHIEKDIVQEKSKNRGKRNNKTEKSSVFEEVKDMVYTHAVLCESMRLYPPVPTDTKEAATNDVLPDGTRVKKGTWVTYHPYAMGRMESIWGLEWAEYSPTRWLENAGEGNWKFMYRDPYSYPVFQAGPRVGLGKEMAFLQMKRAVACIMEKFWVVPIVEEGFEPVYVPSLTAKMQGLFLVRIEQRVGTVR